MKQDTNLAVKTAQKPESRVGVALLLVFALLAVGIVTVGYIYYRQFEQRYHAEVERQLSAIADLKIRELAQWRKERLGDGATLHGNPAFSALVRRLFEDRNDSHAQQHLQAWLGKYPDAYHYDQIRLLDTQGVTRLAVPVGRTELASVVLQHLPGLLRSNQVAFVDFYRNEHDRRVYLAVMVPIHDPADSNAPLGALVLRIDPERHLYPSIKSWPTSSLTAETLLVRREASEVLFLNELRFKSNTALNLRSSLDRTTLPAVQAALGRQGPFEGVDYRGVPVISALRTIPESPWALVARMDCAEVLAPVRERRGQVAAMIGLLLFAAGAGVLLAWRQHKLRFYREQAAITETLRQTSEYLESLIKHANAPIIVWNPQYHITRFNQAFESLTGRTAPDVLGKSIDLLFPPAEVETSMRLIRKTTGGERWETVEIPILHVDGPVRTVLWNSATVFAPDGRTPVATIAQGQDITDRKATETQLRRSLADLERSNKELEQFAYVASHDLQEPLRMVSSYTQLLAQRYESLLDDRARKYINYAVDGAVRMQTLINDLLAYSRVGTRAQPLKPIDSRDALEGATRNLAAAIHENRAIITSDSLPTICADASQLVLVFQNLIGNAIKFRRQDIPAVHVSAQDLGAEWLFSIKDNGIGIEPQHAQRVFVIFQRLHTRQEYPGTGIGLAICKRIVERHGGRIWFTSEPGNSTTFFFTVPKLTSSNSETIEIHRPV